MTSIPAYPQLLEMLGDLRRQWRARQVTEGLLLAAAVIGAVLIVTVAADNLFKFSAAGRAVLAVILWACVIAAPVGLVIGRWLTKRRDDFFAAMVEQQHPELHNQLINALQLGRGKQFGSQRMIDAIVTDAARSAVDLEMADCLDAKRVRRGMMLTGGMLLLLLIYAGLFTARFTNGLQRVLLPAADISPFTATTIEDLTVAGERKDVRVPEGTNVQVRVSVSGVVPGSATLYRRTKGKPWRAALMSPLKTDAKTFSFAVAQVSESFECYVAANDARSRRYRVEVVQRPRVERIELTIAGPAYTGAEPTQIDRSDGNIAALCGAHVTMSLYPTKPLSEAQLVTESGRAMALKHDTATGPWTTTYVLWSDAIKSTAAPAATLMAAPQRYRIQMRDTEGFENADPLWRSITMLKDQAPTVRIPVPGRDTQIGPAENLDLRIDARDDYGVVEVRLWYRVNDTGQARLAQQFTRPPQLGQRNGSDTFTWPMADTGAKGGDLIQYWATAVDRNDITGPSEGQSRRFSIFITTPEVAAAKLELAITDYAAVLEELVRLQRENRAQTASGVAIETLVRRQGLIRRQTRVLGRAMEKDGSPMITVIARLDELHAGEMAEAIGLLESVRDTKDLTQAGNIRQQSLPVQDKIIAELQQLLERLQRNTQARQTLRKIQKKDKASHTKITAKLREMTEDLSKMLKDETELAGKFERLPKKEDDELNEETLAALEDLEEFAKKWGKWAKGSINELTKLPTGFVDDFGLREDVNRIFEEVESSPRKKATPIPVALEDMGVALAQALLEDLEVWLMESPDSARWEMEEPLTNARMEIPEAPLPDALEDMIGELMEEAEDFDTEADDITSAWGDSLPQAGWAVMDGPISNFSAKGRTGNNLPDAHEVTGRAGDGRRGKSSGQMVGDTARGLKGRKTPARVNNERYEPGQLKVEGWQDPAGATGGGKKAGAGQRGLQGGTPPDFVRDMERLKQRQAGLRERTEQIARRLDTVGVTTRRLDQAIEMMRTAEQEYGDLRYEDAARTRRTALSSLKTALTGLDEPTAVQLSRARSLPSQLREELIQATDEPYAEGYQSLLRSYFKALSEAED